MKAALLIKQWPIWCIASVYNTERLISITSEAEGMLRPAETHCMDRVRNQTEKEYGPVERFLDREQGMLDPVSSCEADILCVVGPVTPGKVKVKENLVHQSQV